MFWEFPESELILHEQPQHHHQQPRHKVCTIIISTVQMWKLRHREVKEHSQGHTARKWRTGIQVFALKGLHSSVVRPASLPSIFSRLGGGGKSVRAQEHTTLLFLGHSRIFPEDWEDLREGREPPCGERGRAKTWPHSPCVHSTGPAPHSGISGLESADTPVIDCIWFKILKNFDLFIGV